MGLATTNRRNGAGADLAPAPRDTSREYADLDDLWYPFAAGVGALGAFVQSLVGEARARMKRSVARALGDPIRRFRLTPEAWFVRRRVVPP